MITALAGAFLLLACGPIGADDMAASAGDDAAADKAESAVADQAETVSDRASSAAVEAMAVGSTDDATSEDADSAAEKAADAMSAPAVESVGTLTPSVERKGDIGEHHNLVLQQEQNIERIVSLPQIEVEHDTNGDEVLAKEVVILVNRDYRDVLENAGFTILWNEPLSAMNSELLRVRVPATVTVDNALEQIREFVPGAIAAANHVYRVAGPVATKIPETATRLRVPRATGIVGVIDTPIDSSYPGMTSSLNEFRSFAHGIAADSSHGTAVAELIAREGARLDAANVFFKDTAGNDAASTDAIVAALDWLVSQDVTVVNMSIEGPSDDVLREAIRRARSRGTIVVAAAGNNGPLGQPAYPAAFPQVIAVTAIDSSGHVYRYANQGSYISFAAPGVNVEVAKSPNRTVLASGTSYASPVVAVLLEKVIENRLVTDLPAALALLEKKARHLGPVGRNPIYGYGALYSGILHDMIRGGQLNQPKESPPRRARAMAGQFYPTNTNRIK